MSEVKLEDIVSLAKRRGFIYPGSDVYGGLSGTWDYGPLGAVLKRNIMQLWWKMFVEDAEDMYGVDAAILMNQKVWQASGHVDTFVDPLCEDTVNHRRYRTDHLLKDKGISADGMTMEQMDDAIAQNGIKSPDGNPLSPSRSFNMMFKTLVGPAEDAPTAKTHSDQAIEVKAGDYTVLVDKETGEIKAGAMTTNPATSYLRPETAQGIFTNFKNVVDSFYPDMPFGIAQQGKAFRNEISPRDFIFRSREFEQMEVEYFVHPDQWETAFEEWVRRVHKWCDAIGLPADKVHELEVPEEDRAHYSKRTIDFEFDFQIGREELLGLAYRTDFDLGNIQRVSGKSMEYRPKDGSAPFVPHVIEPSFGVERALMAVLSSAYREDEQNGEKRIYLALPAHLAPVKVAVLPLAKNKPELVAKAREVYAMLKKELGAVMWVDTGNIGKNYRKMDEIGVPYCVTVDFDTLEGETKDTVTVRHRDTTEQSRINISDLGQNLR
jgi:glycyl-tRNA synthetase